MNPSLRESADRAELDVHPKFFLNRYGVIKYDVGLLPTVPVNPCLPDPCGPFSQRSNQGVFAACSSLPCAAVSGDLSETDIL